MSYAQINYPQKLGNSGLTIAEAGCFCTADANLLESVGLNVDPATLNQFYIDHGVYQYDATDRANDDLFWGSASKYDGRLKLVATGVSGWPSSNLAEVRFHYQSISHPWLDAGNSIPNMITHFCKVDDWGSQLIVDSWDGKVKSPGAYGQPTGWAIFEFEQPAPTPPPVEIPVVVAPVEPVAPPAPPFAPIVAPSTAQYTLVKDVLGYGTATNAGNNKNAVADLPAGDYYIFNTYPNRPDLINITKTPGRPGDTTTNQGGWINTADNVIVPEVVVPPPVLPPANYGGVTRTDTSTPIVVPPPLPTPPPLETAPAPTIVTPPVVNANAWKTTNSPLLLDRGVQWFGSQNKTTISIYDLDQRGAPMPLKPFTPIPLVSVFEKDGVRYGRTQKVANAGLWYGIPMGILIPEDNLYDTAKSIAERAFTGTLKFGDTPAILLGKLERFIDGIKQTRKK